MQLPIMEEQSTKLNNGHDGKNINKYLP